jgi:hypothetical protein
MDFATADSTNVSYKMKVIKKSNFLINNGLYSMYEIRFVMQPLQNPPLCTIEAASFPLSPLCLHPFRPSYPFPISSFPIASCS